jgi:Spy/CpxP family protein refolding chaperone
MIRTLLFGAFAVVTLGLPVTSLARGRMKLKMESLKEVGLNQEQINKIEKLKYDSDKKILDLQHELEKTHLELKQQMKSDSPNKSKVFGLIGKIGKIKTNQKKNRVGVMLDIRHLVTPEQWGKMRKIHKRHRHGRHHHGKKDCGLKGWMH